ncbi:complement C3-like [Dreissena polymorpha]|uniref:complement C3-like n=1 Tax=Dreissena polymorpha TaxID=45954 RepID=UPI002264898E|nr:complement C3-like [Dreissena polymorpha]
MVKVTADDLVKDIDASPKFRERLKLIKLVCNGPNGIQTRDIALSFTSGYLIVQTDKPLYNPAQPVYVRVLAMDESMRPIKDKQLAIKLISLTNMTVGRVNFEPGKSQNGFYNGEFELPAFPDFGTWTIKAKLGGKIRLRQDSRRACRTRNQHPEEGGCVGSKTCCYHGETEAS